MKDMKNQLVELLNIQAPSGQEHKVVKYIQPHLEELCDKVWLDDYRNLLAEKVVGSGKGATIILSAHMDSVNGIVKGRKVINNKGVYSSTKGVLGADDRAGMAIIMAVLRNVDKTGFEGTIKVAFSREEEIGCVGSSKIDPEWIKGSDLAFVVDRRGDSDIVVGNFSQAFCSTAVGEFLENCGAMLDSKWAACEGGISDACTFADLGVNSVNLSAGYRNEHTDKEYVVFSDMQKTVNLMLQAFALVNDFEHTFGEVPESNKWIVGYSYGYDGYNDDSWFDIEEETINLGTYKDTFGKARCDVWNGSLRITQTYGSGRDEVILSPENFEKLMSAYIDMKANQEHEEQIKKEQSEDLESLFDEKHRVTAVAK